MKRDMDLIREILLEAERGEGGLAETELKDKGYDESTIRFHCYLLGDAGLAETIDVRTREDSLPSHFLGNLTWNGYEFLDSARDQSNWNAAKQKAKDVGESLSFAVLAQLLVHLAKQKLGLE